MGLLDCVCDVYGVALCFVAVVAVAFLVGLLIGIGILGLASNDPAPWVCGFVAVGSA
mgnify:CR=1 FL=1